MGNKKITGMNVRTEVTGLVEVVAYVEGQKNPYTMHVIATPPYDEATYFNYHVTTDMGFAFQDTSNWQIEQKVPAEFKKMAMAMFQVAYHLIESNKPDPEPVVEETQE